MSEKPKRKTDVQVPRTWMSKGYIQEDEPGHFTMWRDILVETDQKDLDGEPLREKLGERLGPMFHLRVARDGERIDFQTSRPDGTVLLLHRADPTGLP